MTVRRLAWIIAKVHAAVVVLAVVPMDLQGVDAQTALRPATTAQQAAHVLIAPMIALHPAKTPVGVIVEVIVQALVKVQLQAKLP